MSIAIALLIFIVAVFVSVVILVRHDARKFCDFHKLDFDKFWSDAWRGKVDTRNEYELEKYKIKNDKGDTGFG